MMIALACALFLLAWWQLTSGVQEKDLIGVPIADAISPQVGKEIDL
jgi:hypothetical protein